MAKKRKGFFITFDGPDGCGKSTQAELLYHYLTRRGYNCLYTREPGGTVLGGKIRDVLLNPDRSGGMSNICETLLFEADRCEHVDKVIGPALEKGIVVICDRFSDSTLVYQGYAGGQDISVIEKIDEFARQGVKPGLTIFLDIGARKGLTKAKGKCREFKCLGGDRMERKSLEFHRAVRAGYLALASADKRRIRVIRTRKHMNDTQELIRREVLKALMRARIKKAK